MISVSSSLGFSELKEFKTLSVLDLKMTWKSILKVVDIFMTKRVNCKIWV